MNEEDWLTCADSIPMLEYLHTGFGTQFASLSREVDSRHEGNPRILSWKATQRKLRLFACDCVRVASGLEQPFSQRFCGSDRLNAIRISEQYADGAVDQAALEDALVRVRKLPEPIPSDACGPQTEDAPDLVREARLIKLFLTLGPELDVRVVAAKAAQIITGWGATKKRRATKMRRQQAHILRDIFGNPFRPVPLDPSCLNDKTRSVAKRIYEQGKFANLKQLSVALKKDAGCATRELEEHCQWPIRHVRGCWVVDLVLGKS